MKQVGLTRRWIASDAALNKFSIIFNILVIATLVFLKMTWRESEFIDFKNLFELSKVTFRAVMGLSALVMAGAYQALSVRWIINDLCMLDDPKIRIDKELSMIYGFLILALYLMKLFGLLWGILLLPGSAPSLLLVLGFDKFRNIKESQD